MFEQQLSLMSEGYGEEDQVSSSNHLQPGLKARCEEDEVVVRFLMAKLGQVQPTRCR